MDLPRLNLQEMNTNSSEKNSQVVAAADEKKPRPQPDQAPKCPRCDSGNTKFCYYNNYSLSQPRYFCKACRRYWTKGGTLRNVPVGGGCRKNKRSAKRALDSHHHLLLQSKVENVLSSAASSEQQNNHGGNGLSNYSSPLSYDSSGTGDSLSMAFARLQKQCNSGHLGFEFDPQNSIFGHHLQQQHAPIFGNPVTNNLLDQTQTQTLLQPKTTNLGFLSNFFDTQAAANYNSQTLFHYNGFENAADQYPKDQSHQSHSQPLLPYENLSLSNVAADPTKDGFNLMSSNSVKHEMCNNHSNDGLNDNRILWGFPWQQLGNNNNGGGSSSENDNSNVVLGSGMSNNVGIGYEAAGGAGGGGGRESWSNSGLGSAPSWPNLINSALM